MADKLEKMVADTRQEMKVDDNIEDLVKKLDEYLRTKGESAAPADRKRWKKQLEIYKKIQKLNKPGDDPASFDGAPEVFKLITELQSLGDLPPEVAPPDSGGEMGPEQEKFFQEMGKMADQVSTPEMEKMLNEMAPDMDKMMQEMMQASPEEAQKAFEQASQDCKQQ
jgi:hypothetical protein